MQAVKREYAEGGLDRVLGRESKPEAVAHWLIVVVRWLSCLALSEQSKRFRETPMARRHTETSNSRYAQNPLKTRVFRRKTGAEGEGFEPSNTFVLPVFKSGD